MATAPTVQPMSLEQFGQTIKAKHPEYGDMADADVATKVLAKYPQYHDMVQTAVPAAPEEKSLFQKAKDNFNANTQGAKPGDGAVKGFIENVGQGGGQFVRSLAHPIRTLDSVDQMMLHPMDTAHAEVDQLRADPSRFIGNAIGQVGTGAILGGAADQAVSRVSKTSSALGKPPVSGQNYTPAHAAAFEGAVAPATAMGKNFIPQNVTPEALTPIRSTAARMAQGTPVEQGTVQAATASGTPPLERLGAYQKIVQGALDDLEQQHAPALAQSANVPVDTAPIVQRLKSLISPTTAPADVSAINELASRVQKANTIGDLNKFRQELNTETAPEYRQSQVQAGRSGISSQATSDLAGWVRNAYYDGLQQATGTDFAPLKRQEANLITTQEALQNQQAPLAKAEATYATTSPYNGLSTMKEKAGNIANLIKDPKTTVTQTILRESPATKVSTLLQKSLADLPEAPTSTGVPPPPTPLQPQAQLPAQSGGAYPMPGKVPSATAMTAGEKSAALSQWLRQRQQPALPAKVAPIPLPPPR